MKLFFPILFSLLLGKFLFSQGSDIKRTYHWYFGDKAGIDFSSGAPVAVTTSQMDVWEGCITMSDTSGNLLFYSDGLKVWDKNHQLMPNGTGLVAWGAPTTSELLCLPQPGNSTIYYLFSLGYDSTGFDGEWRYAIIDMSLNGGLGDAVSKRNFLCNNATETITGVRHANNSDIWVLTMQRNTNAFSAYLLTNSGLNITPIVSNGGRVTDKMHFLKTSPDGSKLAVAFLFYEPEILDFDKSTGMVSNPIIFPPLSNQSESYGIEFSPDNKKLFFTNEVQVTPAITFSNSLYQVELTGTPSQILNSKILIDSISNTDSLGNWSDNFTFALQLGPDYKIYGAKFTRSKLAVINSPDSSGTVCNYVDSAVYLQGKICNPGLPNFLNDYFFDSTLISVMEIPDLKDKIICYPNPFNNFTNVIIPSEISTDKIRFTDVNGKEIFFKKIVRQENEKNIITISRGSILSGIYLLNIQYNNQAYSQKLIIID